MHNAVMCSFSLPLICSWVNGKCHHDSNHRLGFINLYSFLPRFANTDLALALSLRQRNPKNDNELTQIQSELIDHVTSYDCNCQYCVNLVKQFEKQFPDIIHLVKRMRHAIPALHVQGHREDCMCLFGTAYIESIGHFHGETAEHYWPEANQLGPQTRQMNRGHRHDTLIDHHNDWNWKKTMSLGECLPLILPCHCHCITKRLSPTSDNLDK
jgi:hypothetical protein